MLPRPRRRRSASKLAPWVGEAAELSLAPPGGGASTIFGRSYQTVTLRGATSSRDMSSSRRTCLRTAPPKPRRHVLGLAWVVALMTGFASSASSLPSGRSWARTEAVSYPEALVLGGTRLDTDSAGIPSMITGVHWDSAASPIQSEWAVFTWRDSSWANPLFGRAKAANVAISVLSLTPERFLLWLVPDYVDLGQGYLMICEILTDRITLPDTAMRSTAQGTEYSGAASPRRRWIARSEQFPSQGVSFTIRTVYSDTAGIWHELPTLGIDEDHCSIAPLSDSSAILAYAGASGLGWAVAEGNRWARGGNLDPRRFVAAHPRFRFRPSGGLWLVWTERARVHVSMYMDGQWSRGDSLTCAHPAGQTFVSAWCDASRDTAERPLLVWSDLGSGTTNRNVTCISFPTDSGWAIGEEVPASGAVVDPTVARDRNGDAWVAWWRIGCCGTFFTHTYVSVTSTPPRIMGAGRHRVLSWSLSEPAPESWWTVLRARNRGPFEEVARVRAGKGLELSWSDTSPPRGVLRYKIRRESVDSRYLWESGSTTWPPPRRCLVRPRTPAYADRIDLEVVDAPAGEMELQIFDLQGRRVLRQVLEATGLERQFVTLDLASTGARLTSGVYFVRAIDVGGTSSTPAKLVIVR